MITLVSDERDSFWSIVNISKKISDYYITFRLPQVNDEKRFYNKQKIGSNCGLLSCSQWNGSNKRIEN